MNPFPNLAPLLEGFFTQRLIAQRHASPEAAPPENPSTSEHDAV